MLRIGLICTGDFGREVGRLVAASPDVRAELLDSAAVGGGASPSWPARSPEAVVTVLWRPSDALCERVDREAFAAGVPWLPAFLEHPYLSVGPWILPPDGPCFRCMRMRLAQHAGPDSFHGIVREAYDADPACGALGHLPAHVRLTAGLIRRALADLTSSAAHPDAGAWRDGARLRMIRYQVGNGRFDSPALIPCHGCPRCDRASSPDRPLWRLTAALAAVRSSGASR